MKRKKKRAQSILEYIIVLSAVIVAVIWAAQNLVQPSVRRMFNNATQAMDRETGEFLDNVAGGSE